jgi:hypothetical protein
MDVILILCLQATLGSRPQRLRILPAPATVAVDARESRNAQPPTAAFEDHEVESIPDSVVVHSSPHLALVKVNISPVAQAEHGIFPSEINCSVNYDQMLSFAASEFVVFNSLGMVSVEAETGSFIEEVVEEEEEGCEDASSMMEVPRPLAIAKDTNAEPSNVGTALTVWRGERIVTRTPRATPTLVHASAIGTPERAEAPQTTRFSILPKRVLELRKSRSFPAVRRAIPHSTPRQLASHSPADATTVSSPSCSVQSSVIVSDSSQLGSLPEISLDDRSSFIQEVEQSTLVERESFFSGKADANIKLHAAIEIEVEEAVVCGGGLLAVVEIDVEEKNVIVKEEIVAEDLRVGWEKSVVVGTLESSVQAGPSPVVEENPTEGIHPSTHTPAEVSLLDPEGDDLKEENLENIFAPVIIHAVEEEKNEDDELIDFVDGAGVYRYFMPGLAIYRSISPLVIDGPAVPTSSPPPAYCQCCPGIELEWDELSIVDDVVAELRCYSLPFGLDDTHFQLAAQDDVDDLLDEGVDLKMWGAECVVVDVDDVEEDGEEVEVERQLLDGTYEEEYAVWIAESDDEDEDEDEEAEVEKELLTGLFDEPIVISDDVAMEQQNGGDDSFDLSEVLAGCYGPDGTGAEYLVNVVLPDFDAVDVLGIYDDFAPVFENVFGSKLSVPLPLEDGWLLDCSSSPSPAQEKVPLPIVTDTDLPTLHLEPAAEVDASDPVVVVADSLRDSPIQLFLPEETSPCLLPADDSPSPAVVNEKGAEEEKVFSDIGAEVIDSENVGIVAEEVGLAYCGENVEVSAPIDIDVPNLNEKTKTLLWRGVTREVESLQNDVCCIYVALLHLSHMNVYFQETLRWRLRPVSLPPSPAPSDLQNELQRIRQNLRRPKNMTDQEKRIRKVWELHGSEKAQTLKERLLRKA